MSISRTIQVPRYLIENDDYINESQSPEFPLVFNGGHVTKTQSTKLTGNHSYNAVSNYFTIDEEFDTFTLEITYLASQSVKLFQYVGDNKTISSTSLNVSSRSASLYFWRTYSQRIFPVKTEADSDGYITTTVIKSGNAIMVYQNNKFVVSWPVSNRFTSKDIRFATSNHNFKRFALTPHVSLPVELHYDSRKAALKKKSRNLQLVDLHKDVYENDVYSERLISEIYSHGNWIYVLDNRGHIVAYSRPRGVDSGTTIVSARYDYALDQIIFELDNSTSFTVQVKAESKTEGKKIPEGVGLLSESGIHKPVIYEGNVRLTKEQTGKNLVHFNSTKNLTPIVTRLKAPLKVTAPLDYSKRLTLKEIREIGSPGWPNYAANITGKADGWWDFPPVKMSTSDVTLFDISDPTLVKLAPGDYAIRGNALRNFQSAPGAVHGFRLTDGVSDYFCKLWNLSSVRDQYLVSSPQNFEFFEYFTVLEPVELKMEELVSKNYTPYNLSGATRYQQAEIEIFKL